MSKLFHEKYTEEGFIKLSDIKTFDSSVFRFNDELRDYVVSFERCLCPRCGKVDFNYFDDNETNVPYILKKHLDKASTVDAEVYTLRQLWNDAFFGRHKKIYSEFTYCCFECSKEITPFIIGHLNDIDLLDKAVKKLKRSIDVKRKQTD